MATDTTSISGAVKRVYDTYSEQQQNLKHRTLDEFAKGLQNYSPEGEGYFGNIGDYGNEAGGAQNENESFRTIDAENYVQWKVSPKVIIWPVKFSGLSAAVAKGDEASFVNIVVDAIDKAKERLMSDENRQFFGIGTGLLASPSGANASNLTSFTVDSTQYLRKNMVVDMFQSTTKTVDSIRISDVDRVNNVIYLATSLGAAITATTQIVKENIRDTAPTDGKEMMGLKGMVDDGTDLTTFQNIDASANRIWRGRVLDASSANLSSDLLQRLIDDIDVLSGEEPDMLIMHRKQRRKYLDIVVPQKRYQDQNMDAGFAKLSFNGLDLFLDKDCQIDSVYALKKKYVRKFELAPLAMGSYEGSDKFLRVAGSDTFESYWKHYVNFGCSKRNALGRIKSLATPSGIS